MPESDGIIFCEGNPREIAGTGHQLGAQLFPTGIAVDAPAAGTVKHDAFEAVNPKNHTVENLANYLCQFAREHFEVTPTLLHLDVPPNLPDYPLSAEVRHNLFLIVKEALNNAVKHSHATDVWLRLGADGNKLEIEVEEMAAEWLRLEPGARDKGWRISTAEQGKSAPAWTFRAGRDRERRSLSDSISREFLCAHSSSITR